MRFGDSEFVYGRALAQTAGIAVMRLAGAELLPYDFTNFNRYDPPIHLGAAEALRERAGRDHRAESQLSEGVFSATNDSKKPMIPPSREAVPPFLNFAPLENGLRRCSAKPSITIKRWRRLPKMAARRWRVNRCAR